MSMMITPDLSGPHGGHGHGGGWHGGRRWYGGGYPYYYGGYPWSYYDSILPVFYVDPVGPPSSETEKKDQDDARKRQIQEIAAAVKAELAKDKGAPSMGQIYMDVLGPGNREGDIDREAAWDEVVDEAVPAREALAIRQAMGLGDDTSAPAQSSSAWSSALWAAGC
jgi:hypothetical protein